MIVIWEDLLFIRLLRLAIHMVFLFNQTYILECILIILHILKKIETEIQKFCDIKKKNWKILQQLSTSKSIKLEKVKEKLKK